MNHRDLLQASLSATRAQGNVHREDFGESLRPRQTIAVVVLATVVVCVDGVVWSIERLRGARHDQPTQA